jgi:N-acetyl-anhydromuramyl-L-alanine amidase AmpD
MILKTNTSPNRSARIHGDDAVRLIVAHTPEGGYQGTIDYTMRTTGRRVSYHLLIAQDGSEATQLVPWDEKAWHAGPMNSLTDGIAIAGHAWRFDLEDWDGVDEFAFAIAQRLVARGLPCQWTTDTVKGGFCRHGDLQADRSDPTPDLAEWRLFAAMVETAYDRLTAPVEKPWPKQIPRWFWEWALWKQQGSPKGERPASAPRFIKPWAWRRLRALEKGKKA